MCEETYYLYVCIDFAFLKFVGNTLLQNFSPSKKILYLLTYKRYFVPNSWVR